MLGDEAQREKTLAGLRQAAGFVRRELGRRLRIRTRPRSHFQYDKGLDATDRVAQLLDEIEPPRTRARPEAGEDDRRREAAIGTASWSSTSRRAPRPTTSSTACAGRWGSAASATRARSTLRDRRAPGLRRARRRGSRASWPDGEKDYRATVRLGFATTTDDLTGEPARPPAGRGERRRRCAAACARADGHAAPGAAGLLGQARRRPPPLRPGARGRGRSSARRSRCTVYALDLLGVEDDRLELEVRCSPGTYVRALARDLGEALGVGGHLAALRRTRSGGFGLDAAVPLEALDPEAGAAAPSVEPASRLAWPYAGGRWPRSGRPRLRHGRDLTADAVLPGFPEAPPTRLRVLDEAGDVLALVARAATRDPRRERPLRAGHAPPRDRVLSAEPGAQRPMIAIDSALPAPRERASPGRARSKRTRSVDRRGTGSARPGCPRSARASARPRCGRTGRRSRAAARGPARGTNCVRYGVKRS